METQGENGGAAKDLAKASYKSQYTVVCRICEKEVPLDDLEPHSNQCAQISRQVQERVKLKGNKGRLGTFREFLKLRNRSGGEETDDYGICIEDFELKKPISKGGFGRVYLAAKKRTGDIYAIKVMKKSELTNKNMIDHIIIERDILASTSNPFVVDLYYAFESKNYLYLVMEYLIGGDCGSLLKNLGCFDEEMGRRYIAEVVAALEYLHSVGIVHRDVKPDNLLITAEGHIKLTDFGLSAIGITKNKQKTFRSGDLVQKTALPHLLNPKLRKLLGTQTHEEGPKEDRHVFGTPDYLSPEILQGLDHGPAVDWWAVGVVTFEFLCGGPPFSDDSTIKIFTRILNLDIPWPSIPDEMSYDAADLISRLLCPDPDERLGASGVAEIKSHAFFKNIDWNNLYTQSMEDIFIPQTDSVEDTYYFDPENIPSKASFTQDLAESKKLKKVKGNENESQYTRFTFTNTESLGRQNKKLLNSSKKTLDKRSVSCEDLSYLKQRPVEATNEAVSLTKSTNTQNVPSALLSAQSHSFISMCVALTGLTEAPETPKDKETRVRTRKELKDELTKMKEEELRKILNYLIDNHGFLSDVIASFAFPEAKANQAPRPKATCRNCYKQYHLNENWEDSCQFHPGDISYSDDDGSGVWSCCGKSWLQSVGCRIGKHDEDTETTEKQKEKQVEKDKETEKETISSKDKSQETNKSPQEHQITKLAQPTASPRPRKSNEEANGSHSNENNIASARSRRESATKAEQARPLKKEDSYTELTSILISAPSEQVSSKDKEGHIPALKQQNLKGDRLPPGWPGKTPKLFVATPQSSVKTTLPKRTMKNETEVISGTNTFPSINSKKANYSMSVL